MAASRIVATTADGNCRPQPYDPLQDTSLSACSKRLMVCCGVTHLFYFGRAVAPVVQALINHPDWDEQLYHQLFPSSNQREVLLAYEADRMLMIIALDVRWM